MKIILLKIKYFKILIKSSWIIQLRLNKIKKISESIKKPLKNNVSN